MSAVKMMRALTVAALLMLLIATFAQAAEVEVVMEIKGMVCRR